MLFASVIQPASFNKKNMINILLSLVILSEQKTLDSMNQNQNNITNITQLAHQKIVCFFLNLFQLRYQKAQPIHRSVDKRA